MPHLVAPALPATPNTTMMRTLKFTVAALAALGWCILPAKAAGPSVSGFLDLQFDRPVADSLLWAYEGYVGQVSLNVPTLNISITPSAIGPGTLAWSNASNWNPVTLSTLGLLVTAEGNGSYVTHINNDAQFFDVLYGHGPTQTTAKTSIYFGFFGTTQVGVSPPIFTNSAVVRFNAIIPEGANVLVDQPQVTLQGLSVEPGAQLTGAADMVVQGNVSNSGSGNFAGTVQGDFINDAHAASGNVANANLLTIGGQLQNSGELFVPGLLQLQSETGNDGTVYLNGGQFRPSAAFTNNGALVFSAGTLLGPGTFTNAGNFQWTGGTIGAAANAAANVVNTGNAFTISGSGQRFLNATLTNFGTITHSAGTVLIGSGALLSNQAGALYDMTGDANIGAGFQSGIINNAGTWRKSAGSGISTISVPFINMGTIAANIGTLSFSGSPLILGSASTLAFQLSGPQAATQYGKIDAKGALTAAGTLHVSLGGSFAPSAGNSFDILDWGSINGAFSTIELPTLASGLAWNTAQLFNTGVISVVSNNFISGDFNRNGQLDGGDFTSMIFALADLNSYKTANGLSDANFLAIGDVNGSGSVNNADLEALRVSLAAKAGTFTLLPEPSTWVLTILAVPCLVLLAYRRVRRMDRTTSH